MLHVIAVITAVSGKRPALLEAFTANVPAVRAEAGCLEYAPAIDAEFGVMQTPLGPDTFVVVEKWLDADALRAHGASPHMAAYREKTEGLVADASIYVLTAV